MLGAGHSGGVRRAISHCMIPPQWACIQSVMMVLQGRAHLITETLGIRGTRQVANGPSGLENHAFYLLFPLWTLPYIISLTAKHTQKDVNCPLTVTVDSPLSGQPSSKILVGATRLCDTHNSGHGRAKIRPQSHRVIIQVWISMSTDLWSRNPRTLT